MRTSLRPRRSGGGRKRSTSAPANTRQFVATAARHRVARGDELSAVESQLTMPIKSLPVERFEARGAMPICVRPVEAGDAGHLIALFEAMSPESRYQRFAKVLEHPDAARIHQEAEAIAAMPTEAGAAWIAFGDIPGEPPVPVGMVRYLYITRESAEVDIAVADTFQRRGIGSRLSQLLVEQARTAGIRKLTWVVQQSNHAMICMLAKAPFPVKRHADGDLILVEAELEPADEAAS